jgi:HPt (histidine-containing phosphotransfer) domain-containing protein
MDSFLETSPGEMQEIRDAIAREDAMTVERTAHHFKGSPVTLSTSKVFRTAASLELIAQSGDLTSAPEICRALEEDVGLFRQALRDVLQ